MPAPDPNGSQPDDWTGPAQAWQAYTSIGSGISQRQTASDLGLSPGTISNYVHSWRVTWGHDLFKREAKEATAKSRELNHYEARDAVRADWAVLRGAAAAAVGVTAGKARDLLDIALDEMLDDPVRRAELTAHDLAALARCVDLMTAAADRLSNIDHRRGKQSTDQTLNSEVLAGLAGDQDVVQVTDSMATLLAEFRGRNANGVRCRASGAHPAMPV